MTAAIAIDVLLWVGVVTVFLCCIGVLITRDVFQRMHYLSVVATVSAACILVAVALQEGWGQAFIKTALVFTVLLFINAVLTHATSRAARVRQLGHWMPDPDAPIAGDHGLGQQRHERQRSENE